MKKLLCMMILLAGVVQFTSCSDDDPTYTVPAQLELKSADAFFESVGGTGTIVVNTTEAVTAKTDASWLNVSVTGNTVNVTADVNTDLLGRSAAIDIQTPTASTRVSATQKGVVYGIEGSLTQALDNKEQTVRLGVKHSLPMTVKSLEDWLTATFDNENDQIVVTAARNETGWRRTGQVAFESGAFRDTLTISQFDFDENVLGEYYFLYAASATASSYSYTYAVLKNTSLVIDASSETYPDRVFTVPVKIDRNAFTVTAGPAGSFVGQYVHTSGENRFAYLMFGSKEGKWTGYSNTTSTADGELKLNTWTDGSTTLDCEFGGTFGNYDIDYWNFQALKVKEFASTNSSGYIYRWYWPVLSKDIVPAASASRSKTNKSADTMMINGKLAHRATDAELDAMFGDR